jgi:hypothetical protein
VRPGAFPTRLDVASDRTNARTRASNTVASAATRMWWLVRERSRKRSETVRAGPQRTREGGASRGACAPRKEVLFGDAPHPSLSLRALRCAFRASRKPRVAVHGHPFDACVSPLAGVLRRRAVVRVGSGNFGDRVADCYIGEQHCGERPNIHVWAGPQVEQESAAMR